MNVDGFPGTDDSDNVDSYQCEFGSPSSDQIWSLDNHGRLISRPSGKCLDVLGENPSTQCKVNLLLFTCEAPNYLTDHIWQFELEYHAGTSYFLIRNKLTGRCVDTLGVSNLENGANVVQCNCGNIFNEADMFWEKVFTDI